MSREPETFQATATEAPGENHSPSRPVRLAVVVTHPIQYFAPLFRRLAEQPEIDLTVLYASLMGAQPYADSGFGRTLTWDIPLLEGYRYKVLRSHGSGTIEGFFSLLSPGIIGEIRRGPYDAVIIFGWSMLNSWMAFASARWAGRPVMLYGDSVTLFERHNGWLKAKIKRLVLGSLFRQTSAFLATGTLNQAFYESYGAPRGRVFSVPFSVDNDFFATHCAEARQRRAQLRASYGVPPGGVLLAYVGKLERRKRPQDILAALERLQPEIPSLGAIFVGEGELRPALEAEIQRRGLKNTLLPGFRNQTELPEVYAMSDVLVLPSAREPWGLVVNEAMACGLPVVATNSTGASGDLVKEGQNGFVYPCGDITALARAVRQLSLDPALRQRMGERSREIIQDFSYERCVEGVLKAAAWVKTGTPE